MANKTIPQLPEQTGKTDNDLLVIVDSGETTTSKIKVSTLLSGAGGGVSSLNNQTGDLILNGTPYLGISFDGTDTLTFTNEGVKKVNNLTGELTLSGGTNMTITDDGSNTITFDASGGGNLLDSDGTNSFRTPQYATTDTAGDGQLIIGGTGSTISNTDANASIIGSRSSNLTDGADGMIIVGGWVHNLSSTGGNSRSSIIAGGYSSNVTGRRNFTSGYLNTNSSDGGGILAGQSNNLSGTNTAIVAGQSNTITHNRSVILGGNGLSSNYDDEVQVPNLTIANYASLNYADDATAAANGIQLGQVYHNAGQLRVRIT